METEIVHIEVATSMIPMMVSFIGDRDYKIYTRKQAQEFLVEMLRICYEIADGITRLEFLPETKDGGEGDEYQGKGARA